MTQKCFNHCMINIDSFTSMSFLMCLITSDTEFNYRKVIFGNYDYF